MVDAAYGSLPFKEAIAFFRDKLNLPTASWTDLWEGMHARAFVVAGAVKSELLGDFRAAVDKAITEGTTLEDFRKDFDQIVKRHGWNYNGGRNWRSRVIYETNLRTAYQAGRYRQLTNPKLLKAAPYWEYSHSELVEHPRELHLAWDGLILRHDDPWWQTHFPPNGWGCRCRVFARTQADLRRRGKSGPDTAPAIEYVETVVGQRGPSPRTVRVPVGIDPGWAYNVGEAAWGRQLSDQAMQTWRDTGTAAWQRLTPGDAASYGRPRLIPLDVTATLRGPRVDSKEAVAEELKALLNADEKVFDTPAGLAVLVNVDSYSEHVDPNRSPFLPYLAEALTDPYEIWMAFEQHQGTGKVELRTRILKAIKDDKGRGIMIAAQVVRGILEAWTFVPTSKLNYLNNQRKGLLLYGREE